MGIHEHAANGGIRVEHRDLGKARRNFEEKVLAYSDAHRNLAEKSLPRHYGVAIWGSARLGPETPEYAFTRDLAKALVNRTGCDIITGGGPGIMMAAPEGGRLARREAEARGERLTSRNIGIRVELPFEEKLNPDIDQYTEHPGFSTRLDQFLTESNAVYVAPGGIGSILELAMVLQLRQVRHVESDFPIIVHPFWRPMLDTMSVMMHSDRVLNGQVPLVGSEDFGKIIVSDDTTEIVDLIANHHTAWKDTINSKVKKQEQVKLFELKR